MTAAQGVLNTDPNIAAPDDFYELLIDTHRGLSLEQSRLVNARLILLLANHIGDLAVLRQAMAKAREGIAGSAGARERGASCEQRENRMSGFASTKDLADKQVSFDELGPGLYGYTAEGDPNSGVVIGENSVLVADAQATPVMAKDVIARIRAVTDKPIRHLVLTHYHAVRVLGASAYAGAEIIASDVTERLIAERGRQDMESEIGRFPRLFRGKDSIPGLTWPTLAFHQRMTLYLGRREVEIIHIGRSHTAGDTVVWLPKERVLFAGDTVEYGATPYCGDAHFTDWPATLAAVKALAPEKMVPGRGRSLIGCAEVEAGIEGTASFTSDLFALAKKGVQRNAPLKEVYDEAMSVLRAKYGHWVIFEHCMPFDVSRAYDEAQGLDWPRIWTAERDLEMWGALQQFHHG